MRKSLRPRQRLGLMGGTFNPVHLGHLRAAEEIAEKLELNQIYFMPSATPPHKTSRPLADYQHRLKMLELAVADRPGFLASDMENHLPPPSYTINTIRALKKTWNTDTSIFFLAGLDSFMTLPVWYQYRELFSLTSFVVFGRAGIQHNWETIHKMLLCHVDSEINWNPENNVFTSRQIKPIHYLPGGQLEISSTDLRKRLESGSSVRYLVPEPVRAYIETHGLYRFCFSTQTQPNEH